MFDLKRWMSQGRFTQSLAFIGEDQVTKADGNSIAIHQTMLKKYKELEEMALAGGE